MVRPQEVASRDELTPRTIAVLLSGIPRCGRWRGFRFAHVALDIGIPVCPGGAAAPRALYARSRPRPATSRGGFYIAHPVGCVLVAERIGRNVTVIGK